MASNVLPLFWHLASGSRDTRLGASADLVSAVEGFQQSFVSAKGEAGDDDNEDEDEEDEDEDEEDDDDESGMEVDGSDDDEDDDEHAAARNAEAAKLDAALARNNSPDVVYTVKRLIRGLASSRESSRLGFAVALTELLARIPTVTAAQVLSLLVRASLWSKGMKGSEERDMMFARLFGIIALADSGTLFASTARLEDFVTVVDSLMALGDAKEWLAEAAGWGLLRVAEGLADSSVEWKAEALKVMTDKLYSNSTWTPEKIALTLSLSAKAPELDWKALVAPTFKHTPLLAPQNLSILGRVLKEGGVVSESETASTRAGTYKPQLHYVWDVILNTYFKGETPAAVAPFADFFRVVVDESLFANTSSPERKYWGFQVFERALPLVDSASVPLVFTPNFMRSWINNLSSSERYLHKAAVSAAKVVQDHVKASPAAGFTLLSQLVGKHGRPDFDRVTKTKTVESIMANLTPEGVSDYVAYLENVILGGDDKDASALEDRRTWALDQMIALTRNGAVPKTDEWVSRVLDFLLVHGFFIVRKADKKSKIQALHNIAKPPFSEATAATARARFASALVEVTAAVPPKDSGRTQGADTSGKLWLTHALETVTALEANKKNVEIVTDADEEIKQIRTQALDVLKTLANQKSEPARGAQILISFLVLQSYDEVEDALDLLEDAVGAARDLFKAKETKKEKKSKRKSDAAEAAAAEDAPPPVDALLDVLIALLDKNSADMRTLANLVFGMVSSEFTTSSIQHLIAQLTQSGATEEVDKVDEDMDEDDDEDAASEADSDAESDVSEIEVESDDEDDAAVDPEFRKRVAEALKVSGMAVDEDEDGDDSDDESVWDDEQMMKVDEQLAAVFKSQASNKKSDLKHAAIESLHFKNRILDFFDLFGKKQAASTVVLDTLIPLLNLARAGGELGNKAAGIIRQRFGKAAHTPATVDEAHGKEILNEIHNLARHAPSAEFSNLCSAASLFAARAAPGPAAEAYAATLADFMTRKTSDVHTPFVAEYIKRYPAKAWALAPALAGYVAPGAGVNAFRSAQAFNMLSTLVTFIPQLVKAGDVTKDEAEKVLSKSAQDVYGTLEGVADGKLDWKADRVKEVARFMLVVARSANALDKDRAAAICGADKLGEVSAKVKAGSRTKEMKALHGLLAQLAAVLGQKDKKEKKKETKRKAEADEEPKAKKAKAEEKKDDGEGEGKPAPKKAKKATTAEAAEGKAKAKPKAKKVKA